MNNLLSMICVPYHKVIIRLAVLLSQLAWMIKNIIVVDSNAQNNHQKLVGHLFKIATLLQTINGFPIGNAQ